MGRLAAIGVVLLTSLAACSGNNLPFLTDPYLGTWMIASGQDTADCGLGPEAPTPILGQVIVAVGPGAAQLRVRDSNHGACIWSLNAHETVATFAGGNSCSASINTDAIVTTNPVANVTPKDYTFALGSGQASATSTFDWVIAGNTCRHFQTETLTLLMTTPQ
jgi:hypothetical protein